MTTAVRSENLTRHGGMYLTFLLGAEVFGFKILRVREIVGMLDVTRVPRTIDCLKGLINLRGKVVPVIDLRTRFDMATVETTEETCVIVMDIDEELLGVVVDGVSDVLEIDGADIEPAPQFNSKVESDFILGMGKTDERIVILLDVDAVLGIDDLAHGGAVASL